MATIKDVAKKAGVSVATVSRAINNAPRISEKTKQKVVKVMQELGYTPDANARALVTQKSATIGVVIPELTDPFFASLASGVDSIAREKNRQLLLSTGLLTAESELNAINLLLERRCDAMVVHSKKLSDDVLIAFAEKVPGFVLIDRHIDAISSRCIAIDNEEGGRIAARHLASLGHQSMACISSDYAIDDPQLRLSGFKEELENQSITLSADLIENQAPDQRGGEIAIQNLLAKGIKFSAVFAYNDAMAIGAISTLEDNGYKVPRDVSVIGFDDVLLARYSRPKLTTLHYPIEEMAKYATQRAIDLRDEHYRRLKAGESLGEKGSNDQKDNLPDALAPSPHVKESHYVPRLVRRESTSELN